MKRLFAWLFRPSPPPPKPLPTFVRRHFEAQDRGDFSPWTRRP